MRFFLGAAVLCRFAAIVMGVLMMPGWADAQPAPLPTFAELEQAGTRIGEIRISPRNIFDISDPKEDKALFRLANALHRVTRPEVIRRALLFSSGEPVSVRVIDETERLLRGNRFLYDVQIRPVAVRDGVVDVEVLTRDSWSIDAGFSLGRAGGVNRGALRLLDYNLAGTGVTLGVTRLNTLDRSATEYTLVADRLFGTWFSVDLSRSDASDGRGHRVSLVRPFHEVDARWAAGLSVFDDDRIQSVYRAGRIQSQFRHRERYAEVFGGWSRGLIGGWAQRYSVGVVRSQNAYSAEPGLAAPLEFPTDGVLTTPFVRYEILEDRYEREVNRNLIGRPEFFAVGLNARLQLGRAVGGLSASRAPWTYHAAIGRGFTFIDDEWWLVSARWSGEESADAPGQRRIGVSARYYGPQSPHRLFYASASLDGQRLSALTDRLELGGDNGLRGFPLRYESGARRVLVTLEQRFFTDLYPWQLFRIGGAAFMDAGRAWGGQDAGADHRPWMVNIGFGLRVVSVRSAFSNVLHVDLAAPVNAAPGVSRVQLLVATKNSF